MLQFLRVIKTCRFSSHRYGPSAPPSLSATPIVSAPTPANFSPPEIASPLLPKIFPATVEVAPPFSSPADDLEYQEYLANRRRSLATPVLPLEASTTLARVPSPPLWTRVLLLIRFLRLQTTLLIQLCWRNPPRTTIPGSALALQRCRLQTVMPTRSRAATSLRHPRLLQLDSPSLRLRSQCPPPTRQRTRFHLPAAASPPPRVHTPLEIVEPTWPPRRIAI